MVRGGISSCKKRTKFLFIHGWSGRAPTAVRRRALHDSLVNGVTRFDIESCRLECGSPSHTRAPLEPHSSHTRKSSTSHTRARRARVWLVEDFFRSCAPLPRIPDRTSAGAVPTSVYADRKNRKTDVVRHGPGCMSGLRLTPRTPAARGTGGPYSTGLSRARHSRCTVLSPHWSVAPLSFIFIQGTGQHRCRCTFSLDVHRGRFCRRVRALYGSLVNGCRRQTF